MNWRVSSMNADLLEYGGVTLVGLVTGVIAFIITLASQRRRDRVEQWFHSVPIAEADGGALVDINVAFVLAEVIARLRAGASVYTAWQETLASRGLPVGDLNDDGIPDTIYQHEAFAGASRAIGAGCRMTGALGVPVADVLESVLHSIEDARAAHDARAVARAGPELTARMLTLLPLFGLGAAWILGASVVAAFTQNWLSFSVGAAGIGLWIGGHLWMRELVARAATHADERVDPLVVIDLLRAALESGASIVSALNAIAVATDDQEFEWIARALPLGASADELENYVTDDDRIPIIRALVPAWNVGASPIPLLDVTAQIVRGSRNRRAREEAERLAIRMTLPVGLTLLPAFVCLGIFPVAVTFMTL